MKTEERHITTFKKACRHQIRKTKKKKEEKESRIERIYSLGSKIGR